FFPGPFTSATLTSWHLDHSSYIMFNHYFSVHYFSLIHHLLDLLNPLLCTLGERFPQARLEPPRSRSSLFFPLFHHALYFRFRVPTRKRIVWLCFIAKPTALEDISGGGFPY